MKFSTSRRRFLKTAALAGAGAVATPWSLRQTCAQSPTPAGKNVMMLRAPKMDKVRIGLIGLGMRGGSAVGRLLQVEGVEITALCDINPGQVRRAQQVLSHNHRPPAGEYGETREDWKRLCADPKVDLVYICTPWQLHTPNALEAMRNGKHAGVEVPAAISVEECWQLVDMAEKTQLHCFMLENCCYGETELLALQLCRKGLLGELMHGEAGYIHDLRSLKMEDRNGYAELWRLEFSKKLNGNLYPTHGLGPVSQYMGINRGDRFDYLVSVSSRSRGLQLWAEKHYAADDSRRTATYRLGDMNTSIIRTQNGRTIMVQHDTTSPRPYSRINLISGTAGIFADYPPRVALDPAAHDWLPEREYQALREKYRHPLWSRVGEIAKRVGGHGGMDFIMDWRMVQCLREGEPMDISVYDAAAWSVIFPLSCESVKNRGASVDIPDFTRGAWKQYEPLGIVGS